MKINSVEVWPSCFTLSEPYTIAYETVSRVEVIFLRIETSSGITGYGCATPDIAVTGETPKSVLHALQDIAAPLLKRTDPLRISKILERTKESLKWQSSALAAIDMALYDILGKKAHLPRQP